MLKNNHHSKIILASQSPRRKYLLEQAGIEFDVIPSQFDESTMAMKAPKEYVQALAQAKAADIAGQYPDRWVIGADTIVLMDDQILGKPDGKAAARQMLKKLSGQTHQVYTGFTICCKELKKQYTDACCTDVTFKKLAPHEIEWYIHTDEPFDKAGAYAIQGLGTFLVKSINGSYTNVVGLPVCEVIEYLIEEKILRLHREGQPKQDSFIEHFEMINKTDIKQNISEICQRMARAAGQCGRDPGQVRLVAVGKTQSMGAIEHAITNGVKIIGENYIQEAREKFDILYHLKAHWHFIGHLQSNKAKYAVRMFDLIHTVDSLKLAKELDKQARKAGKRQAVLIQVNNSGESTKSGVEENQALPMVREMLPLENIQIQGLMTMPPFFDAPEKARPYFAALCRLRNRMEQQLGTALPELSMGMTGDFEVAIQEGATLVRIGTALFGKRQ